MAYGIVHYFPGGNQAQYEASIAAVHPDRDIPPTGQIFHAAGQSEGGWTIMVVHDSKASWEKFRDEILMPRMRQGIVGGFPTPPEEKTFEVHHHLQYRMVRSPSPAGRSGRQIVLTEKRKWWKQ